VLPWRTKVLKGKNTMKLTIEKKYYPMQASQMSNKKIANASVSHKLFVAVLKLIKYNNNCSEVCHYAEWTLVMFSKQTTQSANFYDKADIILLRRYLITYLKTW
jgi:hypothetical protein